MNRRMGQPGIGRRSRSLPRRHARFFGRSSNHWKTACCWMPAPRARIRQLLCWAGRWQRPRPRRRPRRRRRISWARSRTTRSRSRTRVYNQQADTETGRAADRHARARRDDRRLDRDSRRQTTRSPDQSGQNLAWSLGTIQGYDRESVALTVNLPRTPSSRSSSITGGQAYATLDAGAVSATTPAATLQPGNVSDPSLLASTVDADTNDPYIQEEAAALDYDPTQIFNFLHTQIGYNSYLGSMRGARGTLWSNAGNALDVASLGVALMRASGIPAQYVSGTLSQSQAQELILSMFPAQYQTVGYIPAGTQVVRPGERPAAPLRDRRPLLVPVRHRQRHAGRRPAHARRDDRPDVHDVDRHVHRRAADLEADDRSAARRRDRQHGRRAVRPVGLHRTRPSSTRRSTTSTWWAGRSRSAISSAPARSSAYIHVARRTPTRPICKSATKPYPDPDQDAVITGTPYQEVLTNFPLGSQVLTGLFLNVTLSGPARRSRTYQYTIADRIGIAARQSGGPVSVSVAPEALRCFPPCR